MLKTLILLTQLTLCPLALVGQDVEFLYSILQVERNYFKLNPAATRWQEGDGLTLATTFDFEPPAQVRPNAFSLLFEKGKNRLGFGLGIDLVNGYSTQLSSLSPSIAKFYQLKSGGTISFGVGLSCAYFTFDNIGNQEETGLFTPKAGVFYQQNQWFAGVTSVFPSQQTTPRSVLRLEFLNPPRMYDSFANLMVGTKYKLNEKLDLKPMLMLSHGITYPLTSGLELEEKPFSSNSFDLLADFILKTKYSFAINWGFTKSKNDYNWMRHRIGLRVGGYLPKLKWSLGYRAVDYSTSNFGISSELMFSISYRLKNKS